MPQAWCSSSRYGAAVAGRAAVVDVDQREAAAGPEVDVQAQARVGRRGGAAVARHDERRPLALRRDEVGMRRRIVEGVRGAPVRARELDRLRSREEPGVGQLVDAACEHRVRAAREIDAHDLARRRRRAADDRDESRPDAQLVDVGARAGDRRPAPRGEVDAAEPAHALLDARRDDLVRAVEAEHALPEHPLRVRELGGHRAQRLAAHRAHRRGTGSTSPSGPRRRTAARRATTAAARATRRCRRRCAAAQRAHRLRRRRRATVRCRRTASKDGSTPARQAADRRATGAARRRSRAPPRARPGRRRLRRRSRRANCAARANRRDGPRARRSGAVARHRTRSRRGAARCRG